MQALRLSSARKLPTSFDDTLAIDFFCRIFADNTERLRTNRKPRERVDIGEWFVGKRDADTDGNAECFLAADPQRFETNPAGGAEKRLRVPPGGASFGQHWTAAVRIGAGRQSG